MKMDTVVQSQSFTATKLLSDYSQLLKARLTALVLITTLVGFYTASCGNLNFSLLFHVLLGTGLVAAGAAALNQAIERVWDAQMRRTEKRPLPAGKILPKEAVILGSSISIIGCVYLAKMVNINSALLASVTILSYLFIYTPLKRKTTLNTVIGAIPGALPPVIGWTAVTGFPGLESWVLFALVFFWQLPHFLGIAWLYREDYAKAGFKMLSVVEPDGLSTVRQSLIYCLGLLPISLLPTLMGFAGVFYFITAFGLGVLFIFYALQFFQTKSTEDARRIFIYSIYYLPIVLCVLALDKKT